jgi:hypothetical protein
MASNLIDDSTFWLSMTTLIMGSFSIMIRACYRSKCKDLKCCYGLLEIQRDTDVEEHIDIENRGSRSDSIPQRS